MISVSAKELANAPEWDPKTPLTAYSKCTAAYDGTIQIGWRLDEIDPKSLFAILGLRKGDILLTLLPTRFGKEASGLFQTFPTPRLHQTTPIPSPASYLMTADYAVMSLTSYTVIREGRYLNILAQVQGRFVMKR